MRSLIATLAVASSFVLIAACDGNGEETPTPTPPALATDTPAAPDETPVEPTPDPTFEGRTEPVEGEIGDVGAPAALLDDVRTGEHEGFDRIVFEFSEGATRYRVEYVTDPYECGTGFPVDIGGAAFLQVSFEPANAHDDDFQPTIDERELAPGLPAILEAELTCDFEANVDWVAGLPERLDFRVAELSDPLRLVIDIGHP